MSEKFARKCDSFLTVLLPYSVYCLHAYFFRTWLIDDAGISFAYARNLIHGFGLVSQAGAEPLEAYSNPLWTFLLTPLFISPPSDPTLAVKGISLIAIFFSFLALNRALIQLLHDVPVSSLIRFCILLSLSLNTSFVVWTTSGLENPLHVLLSSLYLLACLRFVRSEKADSGLAIGTGMIAAGLALNRPDGIIFVLVFPVLLSVLIVQRKCRVAPAVRSLGIFLAVSLGSILYYQLFRLWYFGDPFPSGYYVKGGPALRDVIHLFTLHSRYVYKSLDLLTSMTTAAGIVVLLLLTLFYMFAMMQTRDRSEFIIPLLLLISSWVVYCLLPIDWMGEYRFATTFFVMFYICFFISVARSMLLSKFFPRPLQIILILLLSISFLISTTMTYLPRSLSFSENPTAPFAVVADRTLVFNQYASMLRIHPSTWLSPDLGAGLYYSRHRLHDLAGLCDKELARVAREGSAGIREYVLFSLRPSFIHLHGPWSIQTGLQHDQRFREAYLSIQEIPFTVVEHGRNVTYFHGDYVRKEAVPRLNLLEELKRRIEKQTIHPANLNREPFPFVFLTQ